jgi:hypothetical protein
VGGAERWGVLILLVIVGLFLRALYIRGTAQLCNGYRLMWMNGTEAVIADVNGNVVTRGTVTQYATNCPFITGYTSKAGFPPDTDPVEGYFLINTESGFRRVGMTEAEWSQQLLTIHWQTPHLRETHPTHLPARD